MVMGGKVGELEGEQSPSVILYDPKTDTWADGPSWPITGYNGSRAVWDGNSVLVLGVDENVTLRFEGGVWSIEEREIPGGFVLCVVAESVYLG